jgi:hypothetical protein
MGRELFYCGCCGKRLNGDDFEHGGAFRVSDGFLCGECAPGAKPPVSQQAPVSEKPGRPSRKSTARLPLPGGGTRRISTTRMPLAAPPPRRSTTLIVGALIAAVALLGLGVFLFSGRKQEPWLEPTPSPKIEAKTPTALPTPPVSGGTPPAPPSDDDRGKKAEDALKELKSRSGEACGREEFGKAIALWEEVRPRFGSEAWKETVEAEIRGVRSQAAAAWKTLVESTPAAAREGLRERIKPWNLPEIARELEEMLKPREPLPALKAYREAWGRALARAAAGEWDAALAELGNPEDPEARAEAEADRALFEKLKALPPPRVDGGRAVTFRYARTPAEYEEGRGIVVRADDQRMEIDLGEKKRAFVEWGDLAPASRAALLAGGDADAPSLAALCLVGREPAAAEKFSSRNSLPAKYWAWAAEGKAAPPPRDRKEYEARDLFHVAEFEWRDPEKYGEAIEKYKMILRDYVGTSIAIRNMVLITKRSEAGKEYVLLPAQLKASGPFGEAKIDGAIPALTLSRDVSGPEEQNTYVEAGFYALPGAAYRGWAFLGACCAETFAVYYQTTEGRGRDPKTRKEYALDPGGGVAMPLDHKLKGLKPAHAGHGGEKKPSRWEWVALPIPASYAAPGRKVFRFLANQKGFSVAAVLFSSMRDRPPDKDEMVAVFGSEMDSPKTSEPGADAPAAGQRGQPRPEDWLVLGLFPGAGIDENLPPEGGIKMKYDASVRGGPTEWKPVKVVPSEENGSWKAKVDFHKLGIAGKGIAFAMIHVRVPQAMKLKLHYEHDDDMKLYVNGQMAKKEGRWGRGTTVLNVASGWNCLLFKIWDNGKPVSVGAYYVAARFTDESDSPVRGLTFDAYGPIRR